MSRAQAVTVLSLFALLGVFITAWGASDIVSWLQTMRKCAPSVHIDTSSFWFLGAASIAGLPLLAIVTSSSKQKILLALLTAWFILAPVITHQYFLSLSKRLSYDVGPAQSFFYINETIISTKSCSF